jgi:hypothetical protein
MEIQLARLGRHKVGDILAVFVANNFAALLKSPD